jgi:hypothetical protein
MPITTTKLKSGKVRVSTPGGVKAKAATPENAARLARLLLAVDHGWKPTGAKAKKKGTKILGTLSKKK